MADIDTVLERLVTDADFRARLGTDPAGALAGYDLDADDLALLASSLDDGDQGGRGVEQRTSKSALVGLLASFAEGGGGPAAGGAATGDTSAPSAPSGDQAGKWPMDVKFRQRFESQEPAAVDDLAAPDDQGDGTRKIPGRPKMGDITLKRGSMDAPDPDGAAPDLTDADSGEPVQEYSFKQGWPTKWQGVAADDGDAGDDLAAPDDTGDDARKLPGKPKVGDITLKRGSGVADPGAPAADDAAPADVVAPGAAPVEHEVRRYDITGAWPKSAPPTEDFLTIEDE